MANEEQRTPGMGDEVPAAAGPEGATSGPAPQAEGDVDLTVEDILGQEQTDDARSAEDGDAPAEATDVANEYLEDLRRVNAEYANYRKRTEANRAIEQQRIVEEIIHSGPGRPRLC